VRTFARDRCLAFRDAEKEDYEVFVDVIVRALRPCGLFVADNLLSHEDALEGFRRTAPERPELSGLIVPIGRGDLVAVRV